MIRWNPEVVRYQSTERMLGPDRDGIIGTLYKDKYCRESQFIFQPVKKIFGKLYIEIGTSFRTWEACLKEIK